MKKDIILLSMLILIQCILVTIIKGLSYPLLLLFILISIFTYISREDWRTGEISVKLNLMVFILAILYGVVCKSEIKTIIFNLACFVLPFILIESFFQLCINRGRDSEKFLVGGGDMILFASMSMILGSFEMVVMLFFACLFSLIASKIINKSLVHFAPFIQTGMMIAIIFSESINSLFLY